MIEFMGERLDYITISNTLRECFNNVDVSVPSWLTEPQDKNHRVERLLSLILSLRFRIPYCNLCAFIFLVPYHTRFGYRLQN
jgi:hypothetical protein